CGEIALEDIPEPDEQTRGDHPDDLALERVVPASLEERSLEEPGQAEVVGEMLDLGRLPLAGRGVLGQALEVGRRRIVGKAEFPQERAVDDEIRVTPDRRGEVTV